MACAESVQGPLAGASDAWANPIAPQPTSSPSAKPAQLAWEGYAELLRLPTVTAEPFTTRGHLPPQSVEVRANDAARGLYPQLVPDSVFPEGALLAELSHDATGNGFVMRKQAGNWSYFELDSRGALQESGGSAWCAGCHVQAPSDHVFGPPRAP